MKALVYQGPGQKEWVEVPDPVLQKSTDAVVKIEHTTICGTDLHILKGDVPAVEPGRILGHEGVGVVTAVGDAVANIAVGDRVIISCVSTCGTCAYCRAGVYSHCQSDEGAPGVGWIFGHLIDGTQAEYVRVPFADTSLHKLPDGVVPEQAVLISDILPTGHEIGVRNGEVKPGDVVAVIGAGPVGLAAITTSSLYGPSRVIAIDLDPNRVAQAKHFGATDGVLSTDPDWKEQVLALTDGLGVDVAIEAVGAPATWGMALDIVRAGGNVANVGVHGVPVTFPIDRLWSENLTIRTGLVNTNTSPMLIKLLAQGRLDVGGYISHHFALDRILDAYDTFSRAAETKALKVVLNA
ncbi:MAG: zinc-dependent alcohol dehydrogenase family protein [Microbacterium sp.]|uniref:zinc-dependent alcohol dehydrogenase family protein n=1 Tax=Microbacterium sp. TaxID=51671 RepID=UPI001AC46507|nr:zinc-dependent alcohol dehydrogenase family protein [Microbacterium sp.]MBN9176585.1 zinc-dependent alcohol dehydrogenase family protein [Microbacterium sp.]